MSRKEEVHELMKIAQEAREAAKRMPPELWSALVSAMKSTGPDVNGTYTVKIPGWKPTEEAVRREFPGWTVAIQVFSLDPGGPQTEFVLSAPTTYAPRAPELPPPKKRGRPAVQKE